MLTKSELLENQIPPLGVTKVKALHYSTHKAMW